jgi:hypothetical protein
MSASNQVVASAENIHSFLHTWKLLDLNDCEEVMKFAKDLQKYLTKEVNKKNNGKSVFDNIHSLMEEEALERIDAALLNKIYQTIDVLTKLNEDNLAVSFFMPFYKACVTYKRVEHLQNIMFDAIELPNALQTIVGLDLIFDYENRYELQQAMISPPLQSKKQAQEIELELLLEEFCDFLWKESKAFPKKIENFESGLLYEKAKQKYEAEMVGRYKHVFKLKFKSNIEGVAAAEQKKAELCEIIPKARKNPIHIRYDQLAQRREAVIQKQQKLAHERKVLYLDANRTQSRKDTILLGTVAIFTLGLSLIPFAIISSRRSKEINERKAKIVMYGEEIKKELRAIDNEMQSIRSESVCKQNPYIAYTDEELKETLLSIDKLCQMEADIVTNREKRKISVPGLCNLGAQEQVSEGKKDILVELLPNCEDLGPKLRQENENKSTGVFALPSSASLVDRRSDQEHANATAALIKDDASSPQIEMEEEIFLTVQKKVVSLSKNFFSLFSSMSQMGEILGVSPVTATQAGAVSKPPNEGDKIKEEEGSRMAARAA